MTKQAKKTTTKAAIDVQATVKLANNVAKQYGKANVKGLEALELALGCVVDAATVFNTGYAALEADGKKNWNAKNPICNAIDNTPIYDVLGGGSLTPAQVRTYCLFAADHQVEILNLGSEAKMFSPLTAVQVLISNKKTKDPRGSKKGQRRVTANKKKTTEDKKEAASENKSMDLSELMGENPHLVIASVFNAWRKHNPKKSGNDFMAFVEDTIKNTCTVAGITKKAA